MVFLLLLRSFQILNEANSLALMQNMNFYPPVFPCSVTGCQTGSGVGAERTTSSTDGWEKQSYR